MIVRWLFQRLVYLPNVVEPTRLEYRHPPVQPHQESELEDERAYKVEYEEAGQNWLEAIAARLTFSLPKADEALSLLKQAPGSAAVVLLIKLSR